MLWKTIKISKDQSETEDIKPERWYWINRRLDAAEEMSSKIKEKNTIYSNETDRKKTYVHLEQSCVFFMLPVSCGQRMLSTGSSFVSLDRAERMFPKYFVFLHTEVFPLLSML